MSGKPKLQTELDFLVELERGQVTSQHSLSKRISVSVGFVNALLKRAVQKGFVKVQSAPPKQYAYYITPTGFREKTRLVAEYLDSSLAFFRNARNEYLNLFLRAQACGVQQVVLVGCGELADIACLAAAETEIELVAILDREKNADHSHGLPIFRHYHDIPEGAALVITDSRDPQTAYDLAGINFGEENVLAPSLLRIAESESDDRAESTRAHTASS